MPFSGSRSADPSTLSEPLGPGRARVTHYKLELTVDFVGQRLLGHADLRCLRNSEGPEGGEAWELVLDAAANLEVSAAHVIGGAALEPCEWSRDQAKLSEALGLPLRVRLPEGPPGGEVVVRVAYATAAPGAGGEGGCSALQWLSPAQTAGKRFPYMFSQCQAIHARAMLPCQDTCECKATYEASVRCPAELTALMSAVKLGDPAPAEEPDWETPEGCGKGWQWHRFEQTVPIPPYLVAVVCGALSSRQVGPRTRVWSEEEMVDRCAWEFADTEKFVAAGERLAGEYKWGVYDLLVLPPSFPYGGMENPCLTFVTPTLLAGDRSQVHVVAHEVSHSWSGNLVTNETWEHFWLNEGLTVFLELKIIRDVYGEEEATLQLAGRLKSLAESVNHFGPEHNYTCLIPDLSGGGDPDDAFSTVPYIKGMSLFCLLEKLVGGEEKFQPFLRRYFEHFGGRTVSSQSMRDFFLEHFRALSAGDEAVAAAMAGPIAALDWERLWRAPGMPDFVPPCEAAPVQEAQALAARWAAVAAGDAAGLAAFGPDDIRGWSTTKLIVFLDALLQDSEDGGGSLAAAGCARMAEAYDFLGSNCELRFRFLRLALGARWDGARDSAVDLAVSQGRMKFTRPIYRALKAYDMDLARATFLEHRSAYHPICAKMVAKDLEV
ncbi:unnamed protein product [Prorocentrum cordatum]|uniref:Peptidase M1 leukotriene A4 hydrolase/aminopeptidase C-terminal domain-containing protein n=1 Tax=Prorocentrum cordatum TaxID=2364126 RepID=A0ABN9SWF6_9DINO|nr:unnamed protein product [Polarella glacialis]